jgi:hypothetical protein
MFNTTGRLFNLPMVDRVLACDTGGNFQFFSAITPRAETVLCVVYTRSIASLFQTRKFKELNRGKFHGHCVHLTISTVAGSVGENKFLFLTFKIKIICVTNQSNWINLLMPGFIQLRRTVQLLPPFGTKFLRNPSS